MPTTPRRRAAKVGRAEKPRGLLEILRKPNPPPLRDRSRLDSWSGDRFAGNGERESAIYAGVKPKPAEAEWETDLRRWLLILDDRLKKGRIKRRLQGLLDINLGQFGDLVASHPRVFALSTVGGALEQAEHGPLNVAMISDVYKATAKIAERLGRRLDNSTKKPGWMYSAWLLDPHLSHLLPGWQGGSHMSDLLASYSEFLRTLSTEASNERQVRKRRSDGATPGDTAEAAYSRRLILALNQRLSEHAAHPLFHKLIATLVSGALRVPYSTRQIKAVLRDQAALKSPENS